MTRFNDNQRLQHFCRGGVHKTGAPVDQGSFDEHSSLTGRRTAGDSLRLDREPNQDEFFSITTFSP